MPRGKASKKNKRQSTAASQNALTTRLIQISLKTDDHIYNGKHISPSAAKEYVQEITCLKQKCPRTNLRALQVIEKLLRIMKTIITEKQDLHVNDFTNKDVLVDSGFLRTSSPVYSLPDEDRIENFTDIPEIYMVSDDINDTEKRQETIIENVFNAISNMAIQDEFVLETQAMIEHGNDTDIPIIDVTEDNDVATTTQQEKTIKHVYNAISNMAIQDEFVIKTQAMIEHGNIGNYTDIPIIDITGDSDVTTTTQQETTIKHVYNDISNMVIQDKFIIETQAMFEEDDCSQSILDNFHDSNAGRNEILQMENNAIANPSDLNYLVGKTQHLNEISLNFNGVRTNALVQHPQCIVIEPQTNTKEPQGVAICEITETGLVKNIALSNSSSRIQIMNKDSDTHNFKTSEAQTTAIKTNTSFNCVSNKVKETEPQPKEKKKRARKNANIDNKERKRTPKSKVHIDNETADGSNKPQPKRKGSRTKSLVKDAHKKNPDENEPVVKIYNSNIENDLSWVENLRFVREISPGENDPALTIVGENFWDTFTLPNNWNDHDFDS